MQDPLIRKVYVRRQKNRNKDTDTNTVLTSLVVKVVYNKLGFT